MLIPSSPDSMHAHTFCNIDDKVDIRVVVVVRAARYLVSVLGWRMTIRGHHCTHLNILICHPDVVGICCQIIWCGHDCELNGTFIPKSFVCPFPDGSDHLDGCNTVVGNEHLKMMMSATICHISAQIQPKYLCDDRVAIMTLHKVLDLAWSCRFQVIASNEMCGQVVLRCI